MSTVELEVFESQYEMILALSSTILEIPTMIMKDKKSNQNSLFALAFLNEQFEPFVSMNFSDSVGELNKEFLSLVLNRLTETNGKIRLNNRITRSIVEAY